MSAATAVPVRAATASEFARWRRSAVARIPWAGPVYGAVTTVLFLGSGADSSWTGLFAFQNLWVVGLGPMVIALLVGAQAQIERDDRGGGTWYRPVPPATRRVGRFAVLVRQILLCNVGAVAVPGLAGALLLAGDLPLGRLVLAVLVPWLSLLGFAAGLLRIGEHAGRMVVLAAGLVWALLAVLLAESAYWYLLPFAWLDRGSLPVIGTHANGIGLEPGNALATMSPWPAAVLGALLAVPLLLAPDPVRRPGRGATTAAPAGPVCRPGRPRVLRAVLTMLVRTPIRWLALLAVGFAALLLRWRAPDDNIEAFTLLVVPNGALVLAVVLWRAVGSGWRSVATRTTGTARPAVTAALAGIAVVQLVCLAVTAIYLAAGMPLGHAWPMLVMSALTGTMLLTATLWLTVRASPTVAVLVGVIGGVVGTLVGGTGVQRTLWPFVPWSWARYLQLDRMVVIVPLTVVLSALFLLLTVRATRRAAPA